MPWRGQITTNYGKIMQISQQGQTDTTTSSCNMGSWKTCKKNEVVWHPFLRDAVLVTAGHSNPDWIDNGWFSAGSLQIVPAHGEPMGEYFSKTERPTANRRLNFFYHLRASHIFSSCFLKVSEVFSLFFFMLNPSSPHRLVVFHALLVFLWLI